MGVSSAMCKPVCCFFTIYCQMGNNVIIFQISITTLILCMPMQCFEKQVQVLSNTFHGHARRNGVHLHFHQEIIY